MMTISRRNAISVAAIVAAAVGAGVAYATIPDARGAIHGCYKNTSPNQGSLRVIDSDKGQTCISSERPLTWNQQGPTGPVGQPGAQGPPGPVGPAGAQGSPGPGVKTISGEVLPNGSAIQGSGYTVEHLGDGSGQYRISFPPGTWNADPSVPFCTHPGLAITPIVGPLVIFGITDAVCADDGSAHYDVQFDSAGATSPQDTTFVFIATQT